VKRNTKRRLALYGSAAVVAIAVLSAPEIALRRFPIVRVRKVDPHVALGNEASRLLRDLIRIDTSDGLTKGAVDLLARSFACEGIPYEIVGDDPQRPNIVARLSASHRGEGLLLLNHLDVVPPGDLTRWEQPPFAANMGTALKTFYLYGRGTLDMKGQAVASFFAMADLKRSGIVPLHDIVFVGETGEEAFKPDLGIGWILSHRPDLVEGVTDVFNEGGVNESLAGDIQRFGVEVLQKGTINIGVSGRSREALEAFQNFMADKNAASVYRLSEPVARYMRFIGPSRADAWGRSMIEPEKILESKRFRAEAPEIYKSLVSDMLVWGPIRTNASGPFTMQIAYSILPGSSLAERDQELRGWVKEHGLESRTNFITFDAIASPESGHAWESLYRVLMLDPEQAEVGTFVMANAYTNSAYVRSRGLRAYGIAPFNVNINDAETIHHENERIVLVYFLEGVERMKRILREFATSS
jgi:acetylornithine deacetylase/succinyl-diaminopimelate desuccinylase-like protein